MNSATVVGYADLLRDLRHLDARTRTHAEMLAFGAECVGSFSKHKFVKRLLSASVPSSGGES